MGKKETKYRESLRRTLFITKFERKYRHGIEYAFLRRNKYLPLCYHTCLLYREWKNIHTPWENTASVREIQRQKKEVEWGISK